jgi:hypothetical protein
MMNGAPKLGYIPGRRRRQTTLLETARIQGIFRSAAAKLEWANRHIAELELQSSDYLKAHWRFRLRTGAPLRQLLIEFDAPYRVPLRFGLMVGDAANATLISDFLSSRSPEAIFSPRSLHPKIPFPAAQFSSGKTIDSHPGTGPHGCLRGWHQRQHRRLDRQDRSHFFALAFER